MPTLNNPTINWLLQNPISIPILTITLYTLTHYLWNTKLRQHRAQRNKPTKPLNTVIKEALTYTLKEDNQPLIKTPQQLAQKTRHLTGQTLNLTLLTTWITLTLTTNLPHLWTLPLTATLTTIMRARPTYQQRTQTLNQMFAVAAAECKYPKGAELTPWAYIKIRNWKNGTQPGETIITYPAPYQSEDQKTREKFERQFNGTISEENTWNYTWESSKNRVTAKPIDFLPTMAPYPGPGPKWNEIHLGTAGENNPAIWDVRVQPHSLICGSTGSGKMVRLNEIAILADGVGKKTIGEVEVGDVLIDMEGNPTKVVDLSPIIVDPDAYDVEFSDGTVIKVDGRHLWWTDTRQSRASRWNERNYNTKREETTGSAEKYRSVSKEKETEVREWIETLSDDAEITIAKLAEKLGIHETSKFLYNIAREIGPVGEIDQYIEQTYAERVKTYTGNIRRWKEQSFWKACLQRSNDPKAHVFYRENKNIFASLILNSTDNETIHAYQVREKMNVSYSEWKIGKLKDALKSVPCEYTEKEETIEFISPGYTRLTKAAPIATYPAKKFALEVIGHATQAPYDQSWKQSKIAVRTTLEIKDTLTVSNPTDAEPRNHSIPVAKPFNLPEADLIIPPYTLGVWLGDGYTGAPMFCGIDHQVARNVEEEGFTLVERTPKREYKIFDKDGVFIRDALRHADFRTWTILNYTSLFKQLKADTGVDYYKNKAIPRVYLRASIQQRQALLAGLLDTDGTIEKSGQVTITQKRKQLAEDIRELALSLGYRAVIWEKKDITNKETGVTYPGPYYTVGWTCDVSPFRIDRKTKAFYERTVNYCADRNNSRFIVDVRPAESEPMRCIMVDSPTKSFLISDAMIPTHNSVLQRNILFHALAHSDTWKIVGVDPKMVELGWLTKYDNVLTVALTLEEGVDAVREVRDEMMRRYEEMSRIGINNFMNLESPPPALLLMVDETFNFLSPEGIKTDEGKERDNMHAEAQGLLGEIARLGRAAGVFMVLATQRPDATVIKGEMKNNLDMRIAAGRLDTTPSLMVLDSEAATRLPKIKGRGILRAGGDMTTFQGYYAEEDWFTDWLATSDGVISAEGADPDVVKAVQAAGKGKKFSLSSIPKIRGRKRERVENNPDDERLMREARESEDLEEDRNADDFGADRDVDDAPVKSRGKGRRPQPKPETAIETAPEPEPEVVRPVRRRRVEAPQTTVGGDRSVPRGGEIPAGSVVGRLGEGVVEPPLDFDADGDGYDDDVVVETGQSLVVDDLNDGGKSAVSPFGKRKVSLEPVEGVQGTSTVGGGVSPFGKKRPVRQPSQGSAGGAGQGSAVRTSRGVSEGASGGSRSVSKDAAVGASEASVGRPAVKPEPAVKSQPVRPAVKPQPKPQPVVKSVPVVDPFADEVGSTDGWLDDLVSDSDGFAFGGDGAEQAEADFEEVISFGAFGAAGDDEDERPVVRKPRPTGGERVRPVKLPPRPPSS